MANKQAEKPVFILTGRAVRGKRLGTRLGFPTANIAYDTARKDLPKNGVYIAIAWAGSVEYAAVLNQGKHPTAPDGAPTVEAHLIGYPYHEMYGQELTLEYISFIRPEKQFASLDALKARIKLDRDTALEWAEKNRPDLCRSSGESDVQKPNANESVILDIDNVSYSYDSTSAKALDGVSMQIERGSFVAVLGHNGSGKSTLAKLINALYLPTEGSVTVCGMDTAKEEEPWRVRRHAGMVFQNPDNQIVANMVREDVAFGLENLGIPHEDMVERIDAALEAVSMSAFASTAPHMLSGGQKQRVAVAGVLAMQPEIMILDEATAMLDPSGRKDVLQTVRRLNREQGITVVWITHYMEEAATADRVIVLHKGKVAMDGAPGEVFSQVTAIKALGLDVPPMAELALELREHGMELGEGILTVDDMVKELKRVCPLG